MENIATTSPKAKRAYTKRQVKAGQYAFVSGLQYIRDEDKKKHFCLDTLGPYEGQRNLTLYWRNGQRFDDHWIVKVQFSWATLLEKCGARPVEQLQRK